MKANPIVIARTIASHQHGNLRVWVVADSAKHVNLQALINALFSTGELRPSLFRIARSTCNPLSRLMFLLRRWEIPLAIDHLNFRGRIANDASAR
ncbi:hypothetical protein ABXN37_29110 [Piscinibacter sakaiensis]|uniref:hypothetical protein n=1 Tax=Piscinibacter sakaiensis TaxID=1547922 RepID=UPI003729338F